MIYFQSRCIVQGADASNVLEITQVDIKKVQAAASLAKKHEHGW